jgi:hypothetical protein
MYVYASLEFCSALILAFLCMDHTSFFAILVSESSSSSSSDLTLLDNDNSCWNLVWKAFPIVETVELDKEVSCQVDSLIACHLRWFAQGYAL